MPLLQFLYFFSLNCLHALATKAYVLARLPSDIVYRAVNFETFRKKAFLFRKKSLFVTKESKQEN